MTTAQAAASVYAGVYVRVCLRAWVCARHRTHVGNVTHVTPHTLVPSADAKCRPNGLAGASQIRTRVENQSAQRVGQYAASVCMRASFVRIVLLSARNKFAQICVAVIRNIFRKSVSTTDSSIATIVRTQNNFAKLMQLYRQKLNAWNSVDAYQNVTRSYCFFRA